MIPEHTPTGTGMTMTTSFLKHRVRSSFPSLYDTVTSHMSIVEKAKRLPAALVRAYLPPIRRCVLPTRPLVWTSLLF
jgi:hypothetical protein